MGLSSDGSPWGDYCAAAPGAAPEPELPAPFSSPLCLSRAKHNKTAIPEQGCQRKSCNSQQVSGLKLPACSALTSTVCWRLVGNARATCLVGDFLQRSVRGVPVMSRQVDGSCCGKQDGQSNSDILLDLSTWERAGSCDGGV